MTSSTVSVNPYASRPTSALDAPSAGELGAALLAARDEVSKVVVGQERMLERIFVCLLAGGHILLEGVPGVGKTVTLSAIATAVGGTFSRIQFTADLMPSDIVGTRIYRQSSEVFAVERGPIFANFVLADEVNRSPAKVQSALLEVMSEKQVTIGGQTIMLDDPFLVLATQNPLESEGVYPLPDAQRDRFLMRLQVRYPTMVEEAGILARMEGVAPRASRVLDPETIVALQHIVRSATVSAEVRDYVVRLIAATREPAASGVPSLEGIVHLGVSSRATLGLVRAARGLAVLRNRSEVTVQDVYDVAYDVLNHRLALTFDAIADDVSVDDTLVELLSRIPA